MENITLLDYWRMYKSKGFRLPIYFFLETHLFDILYKTDTHKLINKDEFDQNIKNLSHGILYMSSWTSVIKKSIKKSFEIINLPPNDYDIIDLGCGKGKVLLVISKMFKNGKISPRLIGIDYSKDLINIAKKNLDCINASNVTLINNDVVEIDINFYKKNVILYLYNPFDEKVLSKILDIVKNKNIIAIYNNPLHSEVFRKYNYNLLFEQKSWHPNKKYKIFKNY
tara:strand:- start:7379 stop:8053 length:675 start_codon:yes stop_codon:yes gene_type:complete